jgi:hypothetical protein
MHRWDICLKGFEDRVTLTGFGGYECENMNHVCFLSSAARKFTS